MSTASLYYVTFSTREEALKITKALLDKKLIACANIMAESTSVYEWEGEQKEISEWPAIMKSQGGKLNKIESCIKQLHSYDCPCILEFKVDNGAKDFLNWINEETSHGKN